MTKEQQEPKASNTSKVISLIAAAVIVGGLGFAGGIQFQKSKTSSSDSQIVAAGGRTMMGQFDGNGPVGMRGGPSTVSAITSSSITINNARTSTETTYAITSATTVLDGQNDANVSDIAVGDSVIVPTGTSDTNTATSIVVNPTMGGPGGMMGQGGATESYDNAQ